MAKSYITDEIEGAKLNRSHIRIMLISGVSFFTDAYDLFVIGVVLLMLKGVLSLGAYQVGAIASAALFGAVLGPVLFGRIADRFGRKSTFWITIIILIIGALGSASASGWLELALWRFILGVGIGGDYPLSSTIVAEYANRNDRGKLVASTFAMQGFGIMAGAGVAFLLLSANVPASISWRLLLAFGALPSLLILYYRLKFKETPMYSLMKGGSKAVKGSSAMPRRLPNITLKNFARSHWKIVLGTALTWLLMDISYYGTGIFTPYLASLFGFAGVYAATRVSAILFIIAAVPGYWIAVATIDREGRKPIQLVGFAVMAIAFLVLALYGKILLAVSATAFFIIYGITFLFTNYGPNTTTYVYPVEVYPTSIRATGHGIAATFGKFGAAMAALAFPLLIISIGKFGLMAMLAGTATIGFIATLLLLPETKRKPLVETSGEAEIMMVTDTLNSEFGEHMRHINSATKKLGSLLSDSAIRGAREAYASIKSDERASDRNVHRIMEAISSAKNSPVAYRDVAHLALRLDDIIDMEEKAASRIAIYRIRRGDAHMSEFSRLVARCVALTIEGVTLLEGLVEGDSSTYAAIQKGYIELSDYESKADEELRSSLAEVIRSKNYSDMIARKEIYETLEEITDSCVDVMDVVNDIAMAYRKGNR